MQIIKPDISINFDRMWPLATAISAFLGIILVGLVSYRIFVIKNFNWGTDFAGGTSIQVQFKEDFNISGVRDTIKEAGFPNPGVSQFGEKEEREVLIRIKEVSQEGKSVSETILSALRNTFGKENVILREVDAVGPKIGRELQVKGFISMLLAMLGILIYIWFRFTPQFAPGAIIALIHDICITVGIFSFFGLEFELTTVAALLTIVGYSVNDTIVVYDRIRDNLKRTRRGDLVSVVVKSLNETLSRTLLTSLTTFLVVLALFIYSRGGIQNFAFVLMVGIIVGTYSSLFIATPTFVWLEKRRPV